MCNGTSEYIDSLTVLQYYGGIYLDLDYAQPRRGPGQPVRVGLTAGNREAMTIIARSPVLASWITIAGRNILQAFVKRSPRLIPTTPLSSAPVHSFILAGVKKLYGWFIKAPIGTISPLLSLEDSKYSLGNATNTRHSPSHFPFRYSEHPYRSKLTVISRAHHSAPPRASRTDTAESLSLNYQEPKLNRRRSH
ncbi:hypothetical protein PTTG_28734 [Puccinia triticina 1-1 BBBD Race 1]|uniref:Uncharacterized protein n=1 Tax=Puccinia triticina (isolate 1-1 / race 1 (BBBD)) TaxID=630390 RepID=A0A180G9M9_PUCT1|nr:hypothetical protein PTTG_28734 [Puccinia triticina 1-1 BBBD Race 1]